MKKAVVNLLGICIAFAIGLSINYACADNLDTETDPSPSISYIQLIDGLYFLPNGTCCSKPIKIEGDLGLRAALYGDMSFNGIETSGGVSYTYDDKGRLTSYQGKGPDGDVMKYTLTYSDNKTISITRICAGHEFMGGWNASSVVYFE